MKKKILIVEDEEPISDLIKIHLEMAGYECEQVYDGDKVLDVIKTSCWDLILLDVMLPNRDGFEIITELNKTDIPVMFITAKNSTMDRVKGLRAGAEDYIVKPFEALELLARIEVIFRRFDKNDYEFNFKDIKISLRDRMVVKNSDKIELTLKEFELLVLLIKNKNMALSREQILKNIWGYEYFGDTRTVDTHIQRLRKKLNLTKNIKTVFKIGYRLED